MQRCVALQPDNGCARLRCSAFVRAHNRDDLEANLARDLGFALWRSSLRVKGKESQRIETCVMIAREVVAHLKRSLWRF